ncbi:ABC transporter ATP-binding protein/permease [Ktedonosporobacter rubrisoli]|uniref:ABC transporter ATP-binding protein/permease n=1 Tax=Ktedonosporobacter rubrisoli TaxID=2509675 RepID=A0A4P6K2Q8_KTERU|nr:ABC transporter ATP-binding protein/permease [Ktedonosporobacter rubrisoli]QBD82424.1 ABC transporter ATP-binding protein/permease [Ktedonosporobacter rubrisoli]
MLQIRHLKKTYQPGTQASVIALNDINLAFDQGEFVCILGKSGSGKSTFLNLLAGLDYPTEGEILIKSSNISQLKDREIANFRKDSIGFIFQDFQLLEHLTAVENVELGLMMFPLSQREKRKRALQALQEVGLEMRASSRAATLSGGEKQRVAIARALVKDPDIVIADEPSGALDSKTSELIFSLLQKIAQAGKLVIVVTHDNDALRYATHLVELRDGVVITDQMLPYQQLEALPAEPKPQRPALPKQRSSDPLTPFRLSAKQILEKKWRYVLVSIGMVIGIAGLASALNLNNGIAAYMAYARQRIVDDSKLTFIKQGQMNFNDSLHIEHDPRVRLVQDEYELNGKILWHQQEIDLKLDPLLQQKYWGLYTTPRVIAGSLPKDGTDEIALSATIAQRLLGGSDFQRLIGTKIELKSLALDPFNAYPARWNEQTFTVTGVTEKTLIGEDHGYLPYATDKDLVRRSQFLGKNADIPTNQLSVYLANSQDVPGIVKTFRGEYTVVTPEDVLKDLTNLFQNFTLIILSASLLILFIAVLMIGIILYISVLERLQEIGLLISLGATRNDIKKLFLAEALLLGLFASILGIVLSLIAQLVVNPLITAYMNYALLQPSVVTLGSTIAIAMIVSFAASLIPASKAARLSAIELLRRH